MIRDAKDEVRRGQTALAWRAGLLGGIAACALAVPANAQDTDDNSGEDADPRSRVIVVTAERRETNLQETPLSIIAITDEVIEAKNIDDLADLAKFTPNLTISPGRGSGNSNPSFAIRGVAGGGGATGERGVGQTVLTPCAAEKMVKSGPQNEQRMALSLWFPSERAQTCAKNRALPRMPVQS